MNKLFKKLKNSKYFPIFIIFCTLVIIIILLIIKSLIVGATVSTYGNRLKGIKNVPFSNKSEITKNISSNEKVDDANIVVKGKLITIIFNVSDDVSVDDAKNIASSSLEKFSKKVKNFYDIQVLITKKTEKGTEEQVETSDGKTKMETKKEFPIAGYKNTKSDGFVL